MNKWNQRFFKLAKEVASWSKEGKQVGCVAVDRNTNKVLSCGYNGLPAFMKDDCLTTLDQKDKSLLVHHAEHNTLDQLSKEDYFKEIDLYVTKTPCHLCAIKMVNSQANIKRIFYIPSHNSSFNERYNVSASLKYLEDNGIETIPISYETDLTSQVIMVQQLSEKNKDVHSQIEYISSFLTTCSTLVENLSKTARVDIKEILKRFPSEALLDFAEECESVQAQAFFEWYKLNYGDSNELDSL